MEIIFEVILSFLLEFGGQLLLELLAEFGIRGVSNVLGIEKPRRPLFAFAGYILLAAIAATFSLFIFEEHFFQVRHFQIMNLIVTPVLVGLLMKLRGRILEKHNKKVIRIDSFWYGYVFALTFALVRFFFAK